MGELVGPGENNLREWSNGDVGALSGANLVGDPAVEFASELSTGQEGGSKELW